MAITKIRLILRRLSEQVPEFRVVVWVCPTCGNYFGSSSAENLADQFNTDLKGTKTFSRTRCPNCHDQRVACAMMVELVPKESEAKSACSWIEAICGPFALII